MEEISRENPEAPVVYVDAGDSEETSVQLSNLTKGTAMHRLLGAAGCRAVTVGNAAMPRYGPQILAEHASASSYPHLLANVISANGEQIPGTQAAGILETGDLKLGLIGVTALDQFQTTYEKFFDLQIRPLQPLVQRLAGELRQAGAHATVLLSHLGLEQDRRLASELPDTIPLIVGAHSHSLLPEGEQIDGVTIAQAGEYAKFLGRIDLIWDGQSLRVGKVTTIEVSESVPPSPRIRALKERMEGEVEGLLQEVLGNLPSRLDFSTESECGVANLMADALRARLGTDLGVAVAGQAFDGPLPAGELIRKHLWEACSSPANPGQAQMTGCQIRTMVARGLDPDRAAERPNSLRGKARGLMHISGARIRDSQILLGEEPIQMERVYSVAASDFELEPLWGYVDESWNLKPQYDVPTILREALESYLSDNPSPQVDRGRIASPLSASD
ncbi:MAG: 5'-nucleotidase C-terminal domain-containing protein [Anaerolineales bacterium]|nr:5'-nucleotidase C-terminal domain-containing protein [Anaerolineales bacterium]